MKSTGLTRPLVSHGFIFVALSLSGVLTVTAYVGGWLSRAGGVTSTPSAAAQQERTNARRPRTRNLSLRPEAQSFARRVGRRFAEPGRESSLTVGKLTVGDEQRHVRIFRLQDDRGERVEVSFGGRQEILSWDAEGGALSSGAQADDAQGALLERLVMDSPDQFALAQLRGASYYTVARNVRPTDDGGADGYSGPLYDVVRVGEPARDGGKGWASAWRLYYVNTQTGFVEKVVSEDEGGAKVEAVLSEWGTHAGEALPSRVTWSRGGRVLMELTTLSVGHGPEQ
jgi:hypothetical protein